MAYRDKRKLQGVGPSDTPSINLPREWVDYWHLKKGDELTIYGSRILMIVPPGMEDIAERMERAANNEV